MTEFSRRELLLKGTSAAAVAAAAYALRGPAGTLRPGTARAATTTGVESRSRLADRPIPLGRDRPGFSVCGTGMHQSPVDIETAHVASSTVRRWSSVSRVRARTREHRPRCRGADPRGVEDVLQIGGDRYQLTQYHFHALSEHTVDGQHADVEGHFVHTNAAGDTAVVGVLYRIGEAEPAARHDPPPPRRRRARRGRPAGEANPADLLSGINGVRARHGRVHLDAFYAYDGSLTTPGAPRTYVGPSCPTEGTSLRRRGPLPRRDRAVRRLRWLREQQPPGPAAQRPRHPTSPRQPPPLRGPIWLPRLRRAPSSSATARSARGADAASEGLGHGRAQADRPERAATRGDQRRSGLDALDAQIRQVVFFDTPDLALDKVGVVVRARRIQGRVGDSVIKLRPVDPEKLATRTCGD